MWRNKLYYIFLSFSIISSNNYLSKIKIPFNVRNTVGTSLTASHKTDVSDVRRWKKS